MKEASRQRKDCEEINSNILLRKGEFQNKVIYSPRLVLFDLKGSLRSIDESENYVRFNQHNEQQTSTDVDVTHIGWPSSRVEVIRQDQSTTAPVANTNTSTSNSNAQKMNVVPNVKSWTEFAATNIHSKSIYVVKDYSLDDHYTDDKVDFFTVGQEVFRKLATLEEAMDRIRFFAEECDRVQGFQLLTEISSGLISGMTSEIIDTLRDDYPKKSYPLFTLAIDDNVDIDIDSQSKRHTSTHNPHTLKRQMERKTINRIMSIFALRNQSQFFIPIETKTFLNSEQHSHNLFKEASTWYTSAFIAAAIDTATLSLRHTSRQYSFLTLTHVLQTTNEFLNVCALSAATPCPLVENGKLNANRLLSPQEPSLLRATWITSLSPIRPFEKEIPPFGECITVRGVDSGNVQNTNSISESDALTTYMNKYQCSSRKLVLMKGSLPIPQMFPHFITSPTAKEHITSKEASPLALSALAHLHNTSQIQSYFQQLLHEFEAIDMGNYPMYSFSPEDIADLRVELYSLLDHYNLNL
jgi:hypothetical protein